MLESSFTRFAPIIRELSDSQIASFPAGCERLRLDDEGDLSVYYAPFDYTNVHARVVIVGITPGKVQAQNALREARGQLLAGADHSAALEAAKRTGAFSGPLRANLVSLLDCIGLHEWLGLGTAGELFAAGHGLLQSSSALIYPVLCKGANYNGTPAIAKSKLLSRHLSDYFARQALELRNAVFIPVGAVACDALLSLVHRGSIDARRVLSDFPHPSGANAERIAYFLGRKPASALSSRTDPHRLDRARSALQAKIRAL